MSSAQTNRAYEVADVSLGRLGKKMVATRQILTGEELMRFTGQPLTFAETRKLPEESYALQTGPDQYLHLDEPFCFINHSCDPACGLTQDLILTALRDIGTGEELTYDYSTTMLEKSWTMKCTCGSAQCRKIIADFTTLPAELRAYYLGRKVVQDFIVKAIEIHDRS